MPRPATHFGKAVPYRSSLAPPIDPLAGSWLNVDTRHTFNLLPESKTLRDGLAKRIGLSPFVSSKCYYCNTSSISCPSEDHGFLAAIE